MSATTKITDLVPQQTIDELVNLRTQMGFVVDDYVKTATELAKGLKLEVKIVGDLDKFQDLVARKTKEAAEITERATQTFTRYNQVVQQTTPVIARQLMEQDKLNRSTQQQYTQTEKAQALLDSYKDTIAQQTQKIVGLNEQMSKIKARMDENKKAYKDGTISLSEFTQANAKLLAAYESLKQEKSKVNQMLTAEIKMNQSGVDSYNQLSQQLELMKKQYKDLDGVTRESEAGKQLLSEINELDSHLKDLAGNMGEFQRNVGNYAIAGQNGVVATESLNAVMSQNAITMQDVADQTKILEEGKKLLDINDKNYAETLAKVNARIDENKSRLADVSDIMDKDATSVHEAEEQNKRLSEALKLVDLTADGAEDKIKAYNDKIAKNKKLIEDNTKALQDNSKESKTLADQMLNLIGINSNFGSSLTSLQTQGNVFDGLKTKVGAFGKTLTGILSNPWVLSFLGIAGVAAGFKWWYDYNKGLIEATKLTKNFTGESGEGLKHIRSEVQALADQTGKGFDETIKGANTLVQQYGLKWEEALALMKDGIAAGADMQGNFLSNIERFAPAMRDAGVSAKELVAILAETKNGIFDEKGVDDIIKGGTRLRAMTKQIASSLDAVGISSEKMQKDLAEGNITMLEAVQQVAQKLKELPENSQQAGEIMKNVFGRTAAQGGVLLIESIADVNTNLDELKDNMGEWGELQIKQMEAQAELNETVAAVFDMGDKGFESWIVKGKIFMAETLTGIIRKGVDIINWIADLYNRAVAFRLIIGGIIAVFKIIYDVAAGFFNLSIEGFKHISKLAEGFLDIISGNVKKGLETMQKELTTGFSRYSKVIEATGKKIGEDFMNGVDDSINSRMDKIDLSKFTSEAGASNVSGGEVTLPDKQLSDKEKKELEKAAKEQLKILQQLDESKIALIQNSHEKELATIRLNFRKKLEAIKGDGENETALRIQLLEQMNMELEECEKKYQEELLKINLANRLASVKKGSKEELDIRLAMLEQNYQKEIEEAEKSGADILLIEEKYVKQRQDLYDKYAVDQAKLIQKEANDRIMTLEDEYLKEVNALKQKYGEELKEVGLNHSKREELERSFNKKMQDLSQNLAVETAKAQIDTLEKILESTELNAEERLKIEKELARKRLELEGLVADGIIEGQNQIRDNGNKTTQEWWDEMDWKEKVATVLGIVSEAIGQINDLFSALYDSQISKIEEQQEANEEAGEKEVERINDMVEKQVITQEEGEARKRAAEAKTAKENERLEKKKAELQYKQAVFQKATDLAQAGIATALAITQSLPNFVLAAIAGAMGAIQIATIAATPIPKYQEGTPYHGGGPAIVGDGGKQEVVLVGSSVFLTPDKPTLLDLPKGAQVFPDITRYAMAKPLQPVSDPDKFNVTVNNDYSKLEGKVGEVASLIRMQTRQQRKDSYLRNYEIFKMTRL